MSLLGWIVSGRWTLRLGIERNYRERYIPMGILARQQMQWFPMGLKAYRRVTR
jgi:hypothetical protein